MNAFLNRKRLRYFFLVLAVIIIGLLSRHFSFIPLFIGDILYALMIYSIFRFLFLSKALKFAAFLALTFCFAIEYSQLYKAPWINNIRHTLLGKLVLGEGFLWSDLLCYTVGIIIGALVDNLWRQAELK